MPTFLGRRYSRRTEAVGATERAVGVAILLLLAGIIATFIAQISTNTGYLFDPEGPTHRIGRNMGTAVPNPLTPPPANPFPDPTVADWLAPTSARRYTPDTLHWKINGRADTYVRFHVVALIFGTYTHATVSDRLIDVYWYDMGEPANALAIFHMEAPSEATPAHITEDSYAAGGAVFFTKGSSYVQVLPSTPGPAAAAVALDIAVSVAREIEDGDGGSFYEELAPTGRAGCD